MRLLLKRLLSYVLLRRQGEELFLGFLVLLLFMAGFGFLGVLQDVLAKDPLVVADRRCIISFNLYKPHGRITSWWLSPNSEILSLTFASPSRFCSSSLANVVIAPLDIGY